MQDDRCAPRLVGARQSHWSSSKHDCSATFQGRAILSWHEAEASHYIFYILNLGKDVRQLPGLPLLR